MITKMEKDYISDYTKHFDLEPNCTALIIIDMQYASASRGMGLGNILKEKGEETLAEYRYNRIEGIVIPTIKRLLSFFLGNQLPVIYLTLGSLTPDYSDILPHLKSFLKSCNNKRGEKEHEILEELRPHPGAIVLNKTTVGAFSSTNLDAILWNKGVKNLLFTGVTTNMCVETTARDAADRGFNCVLVEDGCAATIHEHHEATMVTFQRIFGKVQGSEEILRELQAKLDQPNMGMREGN